jgi:hypothetical protein
VFLAILNLGDLLFFKFWSFFSFVVLTNPCVLEAFSVDNFKVLEIFRFLFLVIYGAMSSSINFMICGKMQVLQFLSLANIKHLTSYEVMNLEVFHF